jgi:hypothetical protein
LPLVAIVEGIVHNTSKYFFELYVKGVNAMADSRLIYSANLTAYMDDKIKNAMFHNIRRRGIVQNYYEVLCK